MEPIDPNKYPETIRPRSFISIVREIIERFGDHKFTSDQIFMTIQDLPEYQRWRHHRKNAVHQALRDIIRREPEMGIRALREEYRPGERLKYQRKVPETESEHDAV